MSGDPLIDGQHATLPMLHQSLVDSAAAHIDAVHRAPCTANTPVLFYRMDFHGIGNDLTRATAALAAAMIKRRQLVLLPPLRRHHPKFPYLKRTSWEHPWHWLASAELPLDALLVTSDCQRYFGKAFPSVVQELVNATEVDTGATLKRLGETGLYNSTASWRSSWRVGMDGGYVPLPFRKQGLLWWFQVLTSYFIRTRQPLRASLQAHPALSRLRRKLGANYLHAADEAPLPDVAAAIGRERCGLRGRRPCDRIGSGWMPSTWFDVGLHIRMGDACGAAAPERGQRARRCSRRPLQDAFALMKSHGLRGSVFLATDSARIASAAREAGVGHGFNVSTLPINRSVHESLCLPNSQARAGDEPRCGTEFADRTRARDYSILVDTLLDALLVRAPLASPTPTHLDSKLECCVPTGSFHGRRCSWAR